MGRPPQCNPCCQGVAPHLCCTHRAFQGTGWVTALWSKHMDNQRECTAVIRDLLITSSGSLFLTGLATHNASPVVQLWGTNGSLQWSTDLPAGFQPVRLATDGTQVWVVGVGSFGSGSSIYAFNATTGADLWDAAGGLTGSFSVCSDGAGGCFVGTGTAAATFDSGCETPTDGPIQRHNSSGVKTAEFGRGGVVTALIVIGGKLWAGSSGFQTELCCDVSEFNRKPWRGHLARYNFDGTMELLCANPWETGGGEGSEAVVTLPQDSYVSRLGYYNSRLYAAYHPLVNEIPYSGFTRQTGEMHVSVAEWHPSSGRLVSAWNLETDDALDDFRRGVLGMDGDASNIVITFDRNSLLRTDLDFNAGTVGGGGLVPALDSTGGLYAAIVTQRCDADQPGAATTTDDASPGDPCNCAGATPFGRVNVDCGCDDENDGVPCTVTLNQSFDGCLADFPSSVALSLTRALSSESQAIWDGEFTLVDPGTCEESYDVDVRVTYTCPVTATGNGGGTWNVKYTVYDALQTNVLFVLQKDADPGDVTCDGSDGYPAFGIDWTEADISNDALMPECFGCGETTGCSGFLACNIETDCCAAGIPNALFATFDNASGCSGFSGDTITLVYNSGTSKWEGTKTVGCGDSITLKVYCDSTTWKFDIDSDGLNAPTTGGTFSSAACDPLDLSVTFGITLVDSLSCCPGGGGSTFTITVTE